MTSYIAIDSGGTRTNTTLQVESPSESVVVWTREVYESLSGYLDPQHYAQVLRHILAPIEAVWYEQDQASESTYLFISAAGFTASTREPFLTMLKEVIPGTFGGTVKYVAVANDAVSLLLGHATDGVVIAGTGSSVLIRGSDGTIYQAGGQEWVASDYGAGFWIGLEAIRAVARAVEAGNETTLLHRFCNEYHVAIDDEVGIVRCFRTLAVADSDMKAEIAKFAVSVCGAALKGDDEAQFIVKVQAEQLGASVVSAIRRRLAAQDISDGLNLVQCGSVLSNSFYRSSFESMVSISLYGTADTKDTIRWKIVNDGQEGALALAHVLEADPDSLQSITGRYLPLVLAY